jgi:gliding motility-associated-like protein
MTFLKSYFLILFFFYSFYSRASHVMGGEITWSCLGGSYVFELVLYRDCNAVDINPVSETLKVWNHPTLNEIQVMFFSRKDISPICNPSGGIQQLSCGSGASGGNGIGASEAVIYRSLPINITGSPPEEGWIFTFADFSRDGSITNLQNSSEYGITISSYMFSNLNENACVDSSPKFLQDPYLVSCAGTPFSYNMNAVDVDLDSLSFFFAAPLTNFNTGDFDPPNNPIEIPFETGFSFLSPTPDASFNTANVPSTVNPNSGEFTFTSQNIGNYVVKIVTQSFRRGKLLAQVEREMTLIVLDCDVTNNPPIMNGPFAGNFETTVEAGELVTFSLNAVDLDFLQNGNPQTISIFPSGLMYGTDFTSDLDCDVPPCATLNGTPPISAVQNVDLAFSWQTSCEHLTNQQGETSISIPYHFVFKVQDDFCPVPKSTYKTITINLINPGAIPATQINCVETMASGELEISWNSVSNPENSFVSYEIYSIQNGLLSTINDIEINNVSISTLETDLDFYVVVVSGCDGNLRVSSDTLSKINLELFNTNDGGIAILQWNQPVSDISNTQNGYYHIYREYPLGIWSLLDSVPFGSNLFLDTIDICQSFLNYQVSLLTPNCNLSSNIEGDDFIDRTTPLVPIIQSVSIDTITGFTVVTWDENSHDDTYGYVIYTEDENGFYIELDTLWGRSNTTYAFDFDVSTNPLFFSVSAFDSCFTPAIPPTYQTSPKANPHSTIHLSYITNVCDQTVDLNWTPYVGWEEVEQYEIFAKIENGSWFSAGTTSETTINITITGLVNYVFVVEASNDVGDRSFSNKINFLAETPSRPSFHYTTVATVEGNSILVRHIVEANSGVSQVALERMNETGEFEEIQIAVVNESLIQFVDNDVNPNKKSYTYQVKIIDSCGNSTFQANEVSTILLNVYKNELEMKNYLSWTPYIGFSGNILQYNIYRIINDTLQFLPVGIVSSQTLYFEDDVYDLIDSWGKICYFVEAIENHNTYNLSEISRSNMACVVFEPLIYVPTAFTPEGFNPIFKPEVSLAHVKDYEFTIIDRWGQIVFRTKEMGEGWNGLDPQSNRIAPTGTYMYVLKLKDGNLQEIVKRGNVTLLK